MGTNCYSGNLWDNLVHIVEADVKLYNSLHESFVKAHCGKDGSLNVVLYSICRPPHN